MSNRLYRIAIGMVIGGLIAGCDPSNVPSESWVKEHRADAQKCISSIDTRGIGTNRVPERVRYILDDANHRGWQERLEFEIYLKECQNQTMFTGYQKKENPAELREKALSEWDNAIRDDIEQRRKELKKASKKVVTDSTGSVRVDAYHLKKGGTIYCTTKVTDSGAIMKCDGEP